MKKRNKIVLDFKSNYSIIILVLLIVFMIYMYFNIFESNLAADKEILKIPKGRQVYRIMSNHNSPVFTEVVIDPLDVKPKDKQIMTAKLKDTENIISVIAEVETDTGIKTYTLNLIEGNQNDGIWEGFWIVHDTHEKTYRTKFTATNDKDETSSVTLTWTDPCNPPAGGDWTLISDCNFVGVNGADNGDFRTNGNTLTLDSGDTFVWNPGKTIYIETGSIAIASGALLKQSYLWMVDNDGDGYPSSITQVVSDASPGPTYVRRNTLITITSTDADDGNACADYIGITHICGQDVGGSCVPKAAGEYGLPTCQRCNGVSLDPVNIANNNQDTEGSNTCSAPCDACDGNGNCVDAHAPDTSWNANQYNCLGADKRCFQGSCTTCLGFMNAGYCWYEGDLEEHCASVCSNRGGVYQGTCDWVNDPSDCSTCLHFHPGTTCISWEGDIFGPKYYAGAPECRFHRDGENWCYSTFSNEYRQCACNGNPALYQLLNCYVDADGDGYTVGPVQSVEAGASCPSGYSATSSGEDCDDSDSSKWRYLNGYRDADGDGITIGTTQSVCSGASLPSGWRSAPNDQDCNDGDNTRWRMRYTDADADGYCPHSTQTCVGDHAGYRDSCTTYNDCNDGNSGLWQLLTVYPDNDNDGYGAGSPTSVCSGSSAPSGYSLNSNDCYDQNSNARPGQTSYFTTHRGDGSFDYNCDGAQTKNPTIACLTTIATSTGCWWSSSVPGHTGYIGSVPACGSSTTFRSCYPFTTPYCYAGATSYISCTADCRSPAGTQVVWTQDNNRVIDCR